jgi:hypothetical protein
VPADSLIDASGIAADGGPVNVDVSSQATIAMDDAPTMDATTPTPATITSMWQTNSAAFLATAILGAQPLRGNAVAVVTGIKAPDDRRSFG